ncbi:MAG: endonuclease/exonuclease/phosphatase family protein [Gammaproteobacteria bacterium]|nr:MAG: endonuclease/exonuclease/phosphatase family protein [Gammaproteobacteria bacterium]RLA24237.1 MAG: endonuclease/exonuclease/phosphatase family protein [Gammaproteobacteria bacterium]
MSAKREDTYSMKSLRYLIKIVAVTVILTMDSGCAGPSAMQNNQIQDVFSGHDRDIATDMTSCRDRLGSMPQDSGTELNAANIRLLNWNIKKGELANWHRDIGTLGQGKDLVLIQEAVLTSEFITAIEGLTHWSFSPGYRTSSQLTGVMTLSRNEPLVQCNLTTQEPWLGTPKATSVTEYGLTGTDKTLVVVNLHGVNFTIGVAEFQTQIDQVRHILSNHKGPVIFSGDFNTWRKRRQTIVNRLAMDLALQPLSFEIDHRKKVFGFRLDHSYIRGLSVISSGTRSVQSSDHNPMTAVLAL